MITELEETAVRMKELDDDEEDRDLDEDDGNDEDKAFENIAEEK